MARAVQNPIPQASIGNLSTPSREQKPEWRRIPFS